jgi:hypothetical protein
MVAATTTAMKVATRKRFAVTVARFSGHEWLLRLGISYWFSNVGSTKSLIRWRF